MLSECRLQRNAKQRTGGEAGVDANKEILAPPQYYWPRGGVMCE